MCVDRVYGCGGVQWLELTAKKAKQGQTWANRARFLPLGGGGRRGGGRGGEGRGGEGKAGHVHTERGIRRQRHIYTYAYMASERGTTRLHKHTHPLSHTRTHTNNTHIHTVHARAHTHTHTHTGAHAHREGDGEGVAYTREQTVLAERRIGEEKRQCARTARQGSKRQDTTQHGTPANGMVSQQMASNGNTHD